jgi:hypothetical protein
VCLLCFQLYVYKDRERTRRLVQRAVVAGYSALCLTVDLPVLGNRTSLQRIGFKVPSEYKMANVAQEKETAQACAARTCRRHPPLDAAPRSGSALACVCCTDPLVRSVRLQLVKKESSEDASWQVLAVHWMNPQVAFLPSGAQGRYIWPPLSG